jgi:hypothetical protein
MANLTWGISTVNGQVSEDGPNITDTKMDRFLNWVWARHPVVDGDGNILPRTPAREAESFRTHARSEWQRVKREVIAWERTEAAKAAKNAVQDIED